MSKRLRVVLAGLILAISAAVSPIAAPDESPIEEIRHELMQLPYYGVFDFIAFNYNKGTVTLMGYAYHPGLRQDAQRAVKRASRVDVVRDAIEELPVSGTDDELRWKVYYAIYRDPFLARYAPGGGMAWGHRHPYAGPFLAVDGGPFPGMEPAGDYPIHIIVKNMRVTILGVVDSESDKTLVTMKARQVSGALSVENNLTTIKDDQASSKKS